MSRKLELTIALTMACAIPAAAHAEFGGFVHSGCTKDNFMVRSMDGGEG